MKAYRCRSAPRNGRQPLFESQYMDPIGFFGAIAVLVAAILLAAKYFLKEIAEFVRRLDAPSASAIKKKSDEMLSTMDRNVAERKNLRERRK